MYVITNMQKNPRIKTGLYRLLITGLLILSGCSGCRNPFAPAINRDGNVSLILTDQSQPEGVFTNFAYAYNFKDSLVYSDLLDSSFLFISKNYATNPVTDITWGRDVDIKTTAGLFKHFNTINLIWGTIIFDQYSTDSTNYEIRLRFELTLDGGQIYPSISSEALFYLRKRIMNFTDSTGIWLITRWEDTATF
jgi:hypothetical protein